MAFNEEREGPYKGKVIGYMCKVDYDCELGAALGGNRVYPSIEDLRDHRKCVHQCGIVKVAVELVEVVQEENFDNELAP